jgi:hypothetical protein
MIRHNRQRFAERIIRLEDKQRGIESIRIDPALLPKKDSRPAGVL